MARAVLQQPAGLSRQQEWLGIRDTATTSDVHSADTSGQPLAPATRMFFETRFGVDLGRVRIFSDSRAAREAESINAKAFTTEERIVFGSGAYAPETASGRGLMAHELAHVVQQRTSQAPSNRLYRSPQDHPKETQAEVQRLAALAAHASREGLVLSVLTHSESLTGDPAAALRLCKTIPTLGLTLDPSHFIQGPFRGADFDSLIPYAQNVHFRDTGKDPGAFQVRVGQGEVEYGKIVTQLQRCNYKRALTVSIVDHPDNAFDREVEVRKLKLLLESLL